MDNKQEKNKKELTDKEKAQLGRRMRARIYREKNRERYNEKQREWRRNNPEKVKAIMERYYMKLYERFQNEQGERRNE